MRRTLLLLAVLTLSSVSASALTLKEIVDLHKAGLGDDVLVALIEVEKSVYPIDHETIKSLKAAGLSERVMIAMIKSGRTPALPPPQPTSVVVAEAPPTPAPQVVVIDHSDEPRVREVAVPVAVPVFLPTTQRRIRGNRQHSTPILGQPTPNLPIHMQPPPPKPKEPVYWGFGGKLRPDAWKPAPQKDPRERR
jgi:hypothetical protein